MSNLSEHTVAMTAVPTVDEIFRGLHTLPGLSPAIETILPRLADDDFEAAELCRMLARDPLLAARVLRLANSPFFGLPRQVGSLQEAVMVLGTSNLRGLVLSTGLIAAFADAGATTRSLATAAAAGVLARTLRRDAGLAFTTGLLHNLGELLLGHFAAARWQTLEGTADETEPERLERERQAFGYDNCALAAEIARQWRFPRELQNALRQHRHPSDDPVEPLADLVHVAWAIQSGDAAPARTPLTPTVLSRLGLDNAVGAEALDAASRAADESRLALRGA
ncbi:MAG: metal dependent phosphohydrolase [bacterium]|nr:MAG: metal dependent phosphohydrolase [bacterium]KAF0148982.1 MAG: metal dependent phosphohydrolase [bacterium]KAF0168373.1 MAG: metal dependent phosphohydrolase [bacterium]TXT21037.1 MAG: metal dependent phosphohydrolase [bacterium]